MEVVSTKRPLCEDEKPKESPLNLKGTQFLLPTPPTTNDAASTSTGADRHASPAPSDSELSSIQDVSSIASLSAVAPHTTTDATRPAKRRKLTPGEKIEQEKLKQAKAQEKAVEKAAKEAEKEQKKREQAEAKAKRDEEKHVKDVEKQKKAEERESKKRERELEEERKAQEKLKKERSQMRLGAFFQQPVENTASSTISARRRSLSLETFDATQSKSIPDKASESHPAEVMRSKSEYKEYFLPFEMKAHTTMQRAYSSMLHEDTERTFDNELGLTTSQPTLDDQALSLSSHMKRRRRPMAHGSRLLSVKQIRNAQEDQTHAEQAVKAVSELAKMAVRYIHFHEDERPPYFGTYSKPIAIKTVRHAKLKPFARYRNDTNYDYDSEAEWEDPEPGEDLDSDEDDNESVDDENEMEDFLDDEDAEAVKRKVVGDLAPHSTGVCWQNGKGKYHDTTIPDADKQLLDSLRMQVLLTGLKEPSIDPWSTSYWHVTKPGSSVAVTVKAEASVTRPPLAERSSNTPSRIQESGWPIHNKKTGPKPGSQKTMDAEEFAAFKTEVVGSLLGKQELMAKLKTSFPRLTAVLVKDTLSEKFAQIGKTKANKKWVYISAT